MQSEAKRLLCNHYKKERNMKIITINEVQVKVSDKVYARIEQIVKQKKLSFAEAVSFLLEKVI